MDNLIKKIHTLKEGEIGELINKKIKEFKNINKNSQEVLFSELCFCILTANFDAEKSIKIQNELGDYFYMLSENDLARKLKKLGYRFPNTRAKYISESLQCVDILQKNIQSSDHEKIRTWLINNVKGIGCKEASHFLRNIGFENYAIIDFHIVDILVRYNLIKKPKTLTRKKYLEIENILKLIAEKSDLSLAELDLYLWYIETGKILK
jgi:N-glycosylase/DNA lyase